MTIFTGTFDDFSGKFGDFLKKICRFLQAKVEKILFEF